MYRFRYAGHVLVLLSLGASMLCADSLLSLPDLLLKARDSNPDLLAARQSWKVKLANVSPARAWPDPTFTYIDEKFPSGMTGVDPEHIRHYRVEQMIPFPWKTDQ